MFRLVLLFFALSAINSFFASSVKAWPCGKPMDIAFIVDKSGTVGRKGLESIKMSMEKIVDYFDVSDEVIQYAIMEFGATPRIIVKFNTFTGQQLKSANLKKEIKLMNRIDWGGGSFIDKALLAANSQLFTIGAGMRPNATKVGLVFTDGIQTKDRGSFTPLYRAAEGLKNKGVHMIAVGVGRDIDVVELGDIATKAEDIFSDTIFSIPEKFKMFESRLCSNSTAVPTTSTP